MALQPSCRRSLNGDEVPRMRKRQWREGVAPWFEHRLLWQQQRGYVLTCPTGVHEAMGEVEKTAS